MTFVYKFICLLTLLVCCFMFTSASNIEWRAHTRKYGEPCINHDECIDFRMICLHPEATCQCDQFHDWTELDRYTSECVLNETRLRSFLANQEDSKHEVAEHLSAEAHNLFFYLGLSGIVAISFGMLLALVCIIFVFTS